MKTNNPTQLPSVELPHDAQAESYVLGCLLLDPKAYALVGGGLSEDVFYDPLNREVYRAIDSLGKEGKEIDLMLVAERLMQQKSQATASDLMAMVQPVASTSHLEIHALRLHTLCQRRRLWQAGQRLSLMAVDYQEDVPNIQRQAMDGIISAAGRTSADATLGKAIEALKAEMEENAKNGGKPIGTMTGFKAIDEHGGLHRGDLVIIAGESSQGKTSFALSVVRNAIMRNARIAFYSLEMTNVQLVARILSPLARVPASRMLYGCDLKPWERKCIASAMDRIPHDNLFLDDTSLSGLDSILTSIRMMKAKYGIQGAVIDYLQILANNAGESRMTREQILGNAARKLKNIAKELDIWVIALSQLSRSKDGHEPTLDRIRDSGQIVEAADTVILIYRPEVLPEHPQFEQDKTMDIHGKALLNVAKGRNTGIYHFFCNFNSSTTSFTDMDKTEEDLYEEQGLPF